MNNLSSFSLLPDKVIYNILLNLNAKDVTRLCMADRRFQIIYLDDYLWSLLLQRDFPNMVECYTTYKQGYMLSVSKIVEVTIHHDYSGDNYQVPFHINYFDTFEDIKQRA